MVFQQVQPNINIVYYYSIVYFIVLILTSLAAAGSVDNNLQYM